MAAILSKHLPRGLAGKAHCALGSASHFERNFSSFSAALLSGASGEEKLDYGTNELRQDCALGSDSFRATTRKPLLELSSKLVELRSDPSCSSSLAERGLSSFRSTTSKYQNGTSGICTDEIFRRISSKSYPQTSSVRSMGTAVSTEDKLATEVEDEDLDLLETNEDNVSERTSGKKTRNKVPEKGDIVAEAEEEDAAETSIYTSAEGPSHFTSVDINKYFLLSPQDQDQYFGEGLPSGLLKEFEETKETSLLIRARVLQLCQRFQTCLSDINRLKEHKDKGEIVRFFASKPRQCLLEGFVKGGKSAALAMLVHWARTQGWLVFYVPNGREWTSVGMFYKNPQTGLWDTPVQAKTALEGFLKSHATLLGDIPCRILTPLQLGEGAGTGKRPLQEMSLHEGATLRDLVEKGISLSQAAVSSVVRLREELNLVQEVPVLIAIDEFNSWFTFSNYHESTGMRSRRPIHARELSMVNAFRTMEGPLMMAAAFSQSLAVGKLPVQLPGIPKGVRFDIPRYTLEEATAALNYYYSRKIPSKEPTDQDIRKLFYLTNGNGEELRTLTRLL